MVEQVILGQDVVRHQGEVQLAFLQENVRALECSNSESQVNSIGPFMVSC